MSVRLKEEWIYPFEETIQCKNLYLGKGYIWPEWIRIVLFVSKDNTIVTRT